MFEQKKWVSLIYDKQNRITGAISNDGKYNVSNVTYDKNNNITSLNRYGWQNSSSYINMDILSYEYNSGNKLLKVVDSGNKSYGFKDGNNTDNDYTYDVNGSAIVDKNKDITQITYNHLNLPTEIKFQNSSSKKINYVYDATGTRLKKTVTDGSAITITEYAGNAEYKNNSLEFIAMPEGYIEQEGSNWQYVYQMRDYLDNIRLSYSDRDNDGKVDIIRNNVDIDGDGDNHREILQVNDFYPFGSKIEYGASHPNSLITSNKHNYGFNGQETENSLNLNVSEMTFRQYDPMIGRFNVIDAAAEMAHNWSPYRFGFNNPIMFSDPSGLWEIKDGNWFTNDAKDIARFMDMLGFEEMNNGEGASIAQIDQFIGEEARGSGGRLSDGSQLLDSETIIADSNGRSQGFSDRQVAHISDQHDRYSNDWRNEASINYNRDWWIPQIYSYSYFRERDYMQNGGSFPGIKLGAYAAGKVSKALYNANGWYSLAQGKSYGHNFHGNQYTERRVTVGNLSKWINAGGKMLGAYGLYNTFDQWNSGKLTNFGGAYIGGGDAAALGSKNPYVGAWALGTGIGKSIVESNWYYQSVHSDNDY